MGVLDRYPGAARYVAAVIFNHLATITAELKAYSQPCLYFITIEHKLAAGINSNGEK